HIPSGVRHFTARQLGIRDITVLAEYGQRENTRREHAALIRQHYQYREFAWPWTFRLTRLLYTRSWISNERPGLLFDLATGWLMQHRIILPGATTLTRLISEVREKATLRLWNKLALIPSAEQRSQLEMLLGPTDCSRLSLLESLKKGPVTISGPAFNEAIERWKTLNDFGLHAENLSTLPAVRLKNLARYAGMTSVFNIARMSPQKRMAVLVAFVLAWETLALDDALDVLDAMLAVIIRDARKIGQKKRLRSLKDLDKSALALASACSYLLKEETPDESIRAEVFSYIPRQKLAEIITLVREIARPSDDNFHDEMVEQYGRVRRFLPHLLNTVKFSSAPAGVTTLNACDYLSREFSSRRQFFDDAPTEIISQSWKRLVINKEKHITRRGYTLCFLSKLQDSLRRRDVYVTGSNRWGDPRARLLQGADWQANRIKVYRSLGHPTDPQEAIKSLGHQLDSRYRQVAARLGENEAVELDVSGPKPRLTISPLASLDEPDSLKRLSKMISDLLPPVDLTELLLEINAHTGFADNARLVDFQATLPLAQIWGGGEVASADGMRFVTPVRTINAGPNRKYFGNNRGITWYNFVSDQYSGFHGIVIPGTLRDSIFVLEGLLEQETGLNPTEIMTDTAGASDLVFGLFWLLGYQFSPRLADAGASVFWRMDHDADYGVLNDIARGQSDPRKIVLQWDEMIRTAGSLKLGKVQASVLVRSLLKSERPSGLTQAIIEVGRINKTLYLLNYIDDEDYRRRILTQLNRGESRHAVARAICHGQKGEIRKRYTDGQEDQLGALGLVTNAVVLWNTIYMQAALDHLRAQGETLNDEDIARLSPLCHGHINMLGHYSFTLAELVTKGHLRPLKEASEAENVA
ncbi:Tn3 family transposase, partial [Klebsiella pneumoniae]|uniref:Tn3 family transposase n=1 Tax=Klebsiella pneumoniae TaxID=573 RepID=UPI0021692A3C